MHRECCKPAALGVTVNISRPNPAVPSRMYARLSAPVNWRNCGPDASSDSCLHLLAIIRLVIHLFNAVTSNLSIIVNTHPTPGMSDHEAVTFNVNLNPVRNGKPPHKVFQYKSANWDKLKDDITQLTTTYFHMNPNSGDMNENWNFYRNNFTSIVDSNIPSRNTKVKAHLPWITCEIIRMQRNHNKCHKKVKQTGLTVTGKRLGNSEDKPAKLQPNPTQTT